METLAQLIASLEAAAALPGVLIPVAAILQRLSAIESATQVPSANPTLDEKQHSNWRERIWTTPAETRLGVREAAEAIGRPKSFVYKHTAKAAGDSRLPHRRLDGELLFLAGELRQWIKEHEEVVHSVRSSPTPPVRRLA